jgi:hypothetical protein
MQLAGNNAVHVAQLLLPALVVDIAPVGGVRRIRLPLHLSVVVPRPALIGQVFAWNEREVRCKVLANVFFKESALHRVTDRCYAL